MPYRHEMEGMDIFKMVPPPPGAPTSDLPSQTPPSIYEVATPPPTPTNIVEQEVMRQSYQQVFDVPVYRCTCQRCPHIWVTFRYPAPKTCPVCKSAWWNVRPTGRTIQKTEIPIFKKRKKKKSVKGGKVGRPRRYANVEVPADWTPSLVATEHEEIPEVTMEILGALGELAATPDPGNTGAAAADEEAFPVPTPFNNPASLPPTVADVPDPTLASGQPVDVGGSSRFADEVVPPPAFEEDDGWERYGP